MYTAALNRISHLPYIKKALQLAVQEKVAETILCVDGYEAHTG